VGLVANTVPLIVKATDGSTDSQKNYVSRVLFSEGVDYANPSGWVVVNHLPQDPAYAHLSNF
jgi:hypothetical protein